MAEEATHVDFVGRWIEAAPDDQLEEKLLEYVDKAKDIQGRDAQLAFEIRKRIRAELARRADAVV